MTLGMPEFVDGTLVNGVMVNSHLRVMVELRLRDPFEAKGVLRQAQALCATGFVLDSDFVPIAIVARPADRASHVAAIVRGTLCSDRLSLLEMQPGVATVWPDAPMVQLPIGQPM